MLQKYAGKQGMYEYLTAQDMLHWQAVANIFGLNWSREFPDQPRDCLLLKKNMKSLNQQKLRYGDGLYINPEHRTEPTEHCNIERSWRRYLPGDGCSNQKNQDAGFHRDGETLSVSFARWGNLTPCEDVSLA
jgi:hypothetical protein